VRVIRGKKALVTGAASGIGRAIALRLAREGADLYLLDIDEAGLSSVAAAAREFGVEAIAARCDLGRAEEITAANRAMLSQWGGVDVLVNNAGVAYYGPTENMTQEQWDWLLAINLLAPVQFVQELLPILQSRPEAHIVNMASIWGLVPMGRFVAYNVSKYGLVGLSESLRAEYGRQGLGVTTVCPGFVRTSLFQSAPSGHPSGGHGPVPPRILSTTPERVAARVIKAIRRDQRMVLITPMAYGLYNLKRFFPGFLDMLQRLGRRRRIKKRARLRAAQQKPTTIVPLGRPDEPKRKAA
jgi:NAD(P)-dependent dehydrogenase (short-subunit alcohol dehydrogenase family)